MDKSMDTAQPISQLQSFTKENSKTEKDMVLESTNTLEESTTKVTGKETTKMGLEPGTQKRVNGIKASGLTTNEKVLESTKRMAICL